MGKLEAFIRALLARGDPSRELSRLADAARAPGASDAAFVGAIDALAGSRDPRAKDALAAVALDDQAKAEARARAVGRLAELDPSALAKPAAALTKDRDASVRAALAFESWRLDRASALAIVRAGLDDASSAVRRAAGFASLQLKASDLVPALVKAFEQVDARLRRENKATDEDRLREEAELLGGLAACAAAPGNAAANGAAVHRIAPRLIELAANNDIDDAEAGFFPATSAGETIAATGVPRALVGDVAELLERADVPDRAKRRALRALGKTGGAEAVEALRAELARSIDRSSRMPRDEIEAALEAARKASR